MINEILRDLINKGKVAAFVDNMLVETEIEEEHNKIMEEILKKFKKMTCISSQRSTYKRVGFLEVVIEPNGIEIEKKKMDRVLS